MADPLGYLLTWTTYGTWLPGDRRGWVDKRHRRGNIIDQPVPWLETYAKRLQAESPVVLDAEMRVVAEEAIRSACTERRWWLHALSVQSNHAHAVVSAPDVTPGKAMGILKAAATRAVKCLSQKDRKHWWTEKGSKRFLNTQAALDAAIQYVLSQDVSWKKGL